MIRTRILIGLRSVILAATGFILSVYLAQCYYYSDTFYNLTAIITGWLVLWGILAAVSEYRFIKQINDPGYEGNALPILIILPILYAGLALLARIDSNCNVLVTGSCAYAPAIFVMFLLAIADIGSEKHRLTRYIAMPMAFILMVTGLYGFPFGDCMIYRVLNDHFYKLLFIEEILVPLYIISLAKETCPDDHMISSGVKKLHDWLFIIEE